MALDRVHATSRPYSYKPPKMTSFLWIFLAVGIFEVVLYFGLIGWLPDIVMRVQGSAPCVVALLITAPSYTVVVYKVKKQGRKVAAPSAPAMSNTSAMAANKGKDEDMPPPEQIPDTRYKPSFGASASVGHQKPAAEAKQGETKLETRMLKLCLGITCLFAVSYAALFTRIVANLSHNWDYLYSLNHVGNPVIYCMISKAYRKDVLDTARLILGTIKKTLTRR